MVMEALQDLGLFATGTAAAGLLARYGIQRFSRLAERGIERSSDVVERGIERSSEVVERGIEQYFDRETARHEAEVEAHGVVSSRLHEERASIVVELYRRFVQYERDMRALKTGPSSDAATDQLLQTATESGNDFATYYARNKIYFPPDTCETVERVQGAMTDVLDGFRAGTSHGDRAEQRTDVESGLADWREVTGDEVPELTAELETHFRELLGVDLDGNRLDDS
ncbi:hypothetical protein [Halosimplex salinum]|uniref:hypothetical protein n=1 Tax=Halosimplex salinum TaxID=1710538 RepID=UPI000F476FE5|nr:hypothetical protein [Halosimplex salinum]